MFPNGSPIDSIFYIQNGYFQTCGEIAAVSIAQGGPSPNFLAQCVYDSLVNPITDPNTISKDQVTVSEKDMINEITTDTEKHRDYILDHGYTGIISGENIKQIRGTILISIATKRQLYLQEFLKGLKLYGVSEIIKLNPEACRPLFVQGYLHGAVDANYVFSLMKPRFSEEGSNRRELENEVMDSFQDFLISLEDDGNHTGSVEAVAWNYEESQSVGWESNSSVPDKPTDDKFQMADVTVPGVLGWLTGQKHKPISGDTLTIRVSFDHDCLKRNPSHTICFPIVGACGRELTLPVCYMSKSEQFSNTFLLAYCKGQAFSRP